MARLQISMLADVRGRVEAPEGTQVAGEYPLVIRYPLGLGQMTLVTFDLDHPPVANWSGRPRLVSRVFQGGQIRTEEVLAGERSGPVTHLGFDDLVGQLHGALDQFTGVKLVSIPWHESVITARQTVAG